MMRSYRFWIVALTIGGLLTGAGSAFATMAMQKAAKKAELGITKCIDCHNEKLPKKDAVTYNDKGQWLIDQKKEREAEEVDVTWLKDYVEKEGGETK
jgi:hypothetical protein